MATMMTATDDETLSLAGSYEYETPGEEEVEDRRSGETLDGRLDSALPSSDEEACNSRRSTHDEGHADESQQPSDDDGERAILACN